MPIRESEAHWNGGLKTGKGVVKTGSGGFEGRYSAGTRFGDDSGTNPEELIGAAHAGCFSMALAMLLEQAGHAPERIDTLAKVHLDPEDGGYKISRIELDTRGTVPGIEQDAFEKQARAAKGDCPVSKALAGVEISVTARLE